MCGRFTLAKTGEVAAAFDVPDPPPLTPRYNVAPGQVIAVVGLKHDARKRGIALLRWGLVPHWAASPNSGPRPINVRSESALYKFGEHLRERQCLVPADGFYECQTVGKKKVPHRFTMKSGRPFAFAGLWDVWRGEAEKLVTCCLMTTGANELVRPVHDRMPVIVPPEWYDAWLDPDTPESALVSMLEPYPAELMQVADAGTAVNSPKNDGPECLEAA